MKVCIVTRHDLFPTVHGAAVKIVRTAESLSRLAGPCAAVTTDRTAYHLWTDGRHELRPYPDRLIAATRVPPRVDRWWQRRGWPDYWQLVRRALLALGYPSEEHLLYQPLVDPDFWLRTAFVGRRLGADVYQAEFPGFAAACLAAAGVVGGRTAVVEHNAEWQRLADTTALPAALLARFRRIEVGLLRRVDDVIAVSVDDRVRLAAAGVPAGKITVIPHGVDVDTFASAPPAPLRRDAGVPDGVPLLFFHGTLHYEPNTVALQVLVDEILPRLQAAGREVRVVAGGMHPPRELCHPWLHYTGVIDDLAGAIAASDLCVVPLLAGGGTRLKILEYLAAGRPTVSTTKGAEGLRVIDGQELARVADGDWDTFVARTVALLDDPAAAAAMGRRARAFARRYDWDTVTRAYVELFEGRGRGADRSAGIASVIGAGPPPAAVAPPAAAPTPPPPDRTAVERAVVEGLPAEPRWTKPRAAIVMLNRRCNLRCAFCDHWRHRDELPAAAVDALIEQADDVGLRLLVLTGGEPLLRRDLFPLIDRARAAGLAVNVTTNGTLLSRRIRLLGAHPPDSISVSIDGLDATHDRLRGRDGVAARAWAGLERLRADTDIALNVYFVVTRDNVGELPAVFDRARALGAGFDFWPVNGHPELGLRTAAQRRAYRDAVAHVLHHDPARRDHAAFYDDGLAYLEGRRSPVRCLGLREQFGVDQHGRLVPCCVWGIEDLAVGSVLDTPLAELLASPRAAEVRRAIVEQGCVDRCFNHSLYEFEQATGLPFTLGAAPAAGPGDTP